MKSIDLSNKITIFDQHLNSKPRTPCSLNSRLKRFKGNMSASFSQMNRSKKQIELQSNQSIIDSIAKKKNNLKHSLIHKYQSITFDNTNIIDNKNKNLIYSKTFHTEMNSRSNSVQKSEKSSTSNSLLKRTLKYFTRNETMYSSQESINNKDKEKIKNDIKPSCTTKNADLKKRPLSKDILFSLAKHHKGSKIYKLKIKDIARRGIKAKKCLAETLDRSRIKLFNNRAELDLTPSQKHKSDKRMAKFSFIYYVKNKILSEDKNPSLLAKNRVTKFLGPIEKEEPMEIESFCVSLEQIVPKDMNCFKIESFNRPEFWLFKGYELSKEGKTEAAIDYYLQGLVSNIDEFELNYNVACMFNQNNKLKTSMHYFSKSHMRKPLSILPIFGMAVVLYRLGEYKDSLEFTLQCCELKAVDDKMKISIIFLKAINYRRLMRFEEASKEYADYLIITEQSRKHNTK